MNNQENISNEATSPTTTTKGSPAGVVVSTTTGGTEGTGVVTGSSRGRPFATTSEQDRYDSRKVSSTRARTPAPASTTSYDKGSRNNIHHHVPAATTTTTTATIGRDLSPTSSLSPPALSSPPSNDYSENLLHDENLQEREERRGGRRGKEAEAAAEKEEEEPQQPKAPRSAFICFSDAKKDDILARYGIDKVRPGWHAACP